MLANPRASTRAIVIQHQFLVQALRQHVTQARQRELQAARDRIFKKFVTAQ